MKVNIQKQIGEFQLDVRFQSDASKIGILGASGCGKSMTLKSIAGIEKVDSGQIFLSNQVLFDSDKKIDMTPQERKVGYMFQNYALFPKMTVEQNIGISLKINKKEKREKIRKIMEQFKIQDLGKRFPGELSGGQQQRVALARIMIYKPNLILLDEPFSALDYYLKDQLQFELLELLSDYDGQIIMVSHDRDELYRFSDELFVMKEGKIIKNGTTKQIFKDPSQIDVAKLTGCKNFTSIERRDNGFFYASDWDAILHVNEKTHTDVKYAGYRAHFFKPVWNDLPDDSAENIIQVSLERIDEMSFEKKYYFHPIKHGRVSKATICWFVQNEMEERIHTNGIPKYLQLDPNKIMLLKE